MRVAAPRPLIGTASAAPAASRARRPPGDRANGFRPRSRGREAATGPFGKNNFPISEVNTPWDTPEIWLRRNFTIDRLPAGTLHLLIRHDEDATVYVNGQKIAEIPGTSSHYMPVEADKALRAALKQGANVIAIQCKQTRDDQFIDAGIISSVAPAAERLAR